MIKIIMKDRNYSRSLLHNIILHAYEQIKPAIPLLNTNLQHKSVNCCTSVKSNPRCGINCVQHSFVSVTT